AARFRLPVLMAYLAVLFQLGALGAPGGVTPLLVAEGVQNAHARGAPGRPGARQDAHDGRHDEARDERAPWDREHQPLTRQPLGHDPAEEHADDDAEQAADDRGDGTLEADGAPQLAARHADRAQHADLAR